VKIVKRDSQVNPDFYNWNKAHGMQGWMDKVWLDQLYFLGLTSQLSIAE